MIAGKQVEGKIVAVADSLTLARSPLFVVRSATVSSNDHPSPGVQPGRPSNVRPVIDLSALMPQSGNLFVHHAGEADRNDPDRASSQSVVGCRMF